MCLPYTNTLFESRFFSMNDRIYLFFLFSLTSFSFFFFFSARFQSFRDMFGNQRFRSLSISLSRSFFSLIPLPISFVNAKVHKSHNVLSSFEYKTHSQVVLQGRERKVSQSLLIRGDSLRNVNEQFQLLCYSVSKMMMKIKKKKK